MPENPIREVETAINDSLAPSAGVIPRRATLSDENLWPTTHSQLLTPILAQTSHPSNVGTWNQSQETVTPELNQFRPPGDWLDGQEALRLGETETFQDYGLANIGQVDSLWHLDDLDTTFWPDGMDFSFADDLFGVGSSIGSVPGSFADETPRPELQPDLVGHQSTQSAMEMMEHYFEQKSRPSSPRHEKPRRRWFSAPLRFQIYDEQIMNVFVNIAKHHLIKTFPILDDFVAAESPRNALNLAYAAVGGLFCNIPGRFKVVNSMYNDARRMLLDPASQEGITSLPNKLDAVKTFILLEVYGLCSGDKRSYEFVEAFHMKMLSAVEEYKQALATQEMPLEQPENESRALTESLYVLECYRVILLLRPPGSSFRSDIEFRHPGGPASSAPEVDKLITTLFTPGSSVAYSYEHQDKVITLASIALMSWPVFPRGNTQPQKRTLWNADFLELALNSWAKIQGDSGSWSKLLLYHLIHLNIHTNMGLVQRFAHSPAESPIRAKSGRAFTSIEQWQKTRHYQVAKWHAQGTLRRVKDAMAASQKRSSDSLGDLPSGPGRPSILAEPPHLPYCVYFSALILWCGSIVSNDEKISNLSSIETCSTLLSGMKVRVAELLEGILRELKT